MLDIPGVFLQIHVFKFLLVVPLVTTVVLVLPSCQELLGVLPRTLVTPCLLLALIITIVLLEIVFAQMVILGVPHKRHALLFPPVAPLMIIAEIV